MLQRNDHHSPRTSARRPTRAVAWGSAAVATAGAVRLELDEALESDAWRVNYDLPSLHLSLSLRSVGDVRSIAESLRGRLPTGRVTLGRYGNTCVSLVRDDEFDDRYFVTLGARGQSMRVALSQAHVNEMTVAMADLVAQLDD